MDLKSHETLFIQVDFVSTLYELKVVKKYFNVHTSPSEFGLLLIDDHKVIARELGYATRPKNN